MTKIMIVDDEQDLREMIDLMMKKEGFETELAVDGTDFLRKIDIFQPDLVILDVMMPGEDGFQLCERIRQSKKNKDTPIIFISAKAQIEDKMKSLKVGADDYITKPFDPIELENKIKSWLS